MNSRLPLENADTVSLVCALLVRFPELASIRSMPAEGSVRLTFALRARLDKRGQAALAETIDDHINGYLMLAKDEAARRCGSSAKATVPRRSLHVTRDTRQLL